MAIDRAVKEGLHPATPEFREAVQTYTTAPETGLSDAAGAKAIARVQQAGVGAGTRGVDADTLM